MDMRITSVYGAYGIQSTRASHTVSKATERARPDADSVSISMQASDYQYARQAVANTPDIRESIVSQIRGQIASGTYNVDPYDVATRIFQGLG